MAKFYAVELTVTAIIQVGDDEGELDAEGIAQDERRDIFSDCDEPDVLVMGEVKSVADLSLYGWDERCIPYGGDGNTTLAELLPADGVPGGQEVKRG